MNAERILVTLCTYNERDNIESLIQQIQAQLPPAEILVIDDNSPDGTGDLADRMAGNDPKVHVLHRSGKLGLGSATLAGFQYAIDNGYDFVVNMDADFSHHPRYLPSLLERMADADVAADVAIGSRYVADGGIQGWGLLRHFMSRGINAYARLFLGLPTRDNSGSYRCYRVERLAEVDFASIRSRGYSFQEEILFRCHRVGCRLVEVPIVFEDRRFGESKINWRESVSAIWILFRIGLERAVRKSHSPDAKR